MVLAVFVLFCDGLIISTLRFFIKTHVVTLRKEKNRRKKRGGASMEGGRVDQCTIVIEVHHRYNCSSLTSWIFFPWIQHIWPFVHRCLSLSWICAKFLRTIDFFFKYKIVKYYFWSFVPDTHFFILSFNFKNVQYYKRPILNKQLNVSKKCKKYSENRNLNILLAWSFICQETNI